jgi:hypothetical protein
MRLARPFLFPDPKDRSVNEPTAVISQNQVLGNFNQAHPDDQREKVTEPVKEWFREEAAKGGWASAEFHGSQAVLTAELQLKSGLKGRKA